MLYNSFFKCCAASKIFLYSYLNPMHTAFYRQHLITRRIFLQRTEFPLNIRPQAFKRTHTHTHKHISTSSACTLHTLHAHVHNSYMQRHCVAFGAMQSCTLIRADNAADLNARFSSSSSEIPFLTRPHTFAMKRVFGRPNPRAHVTCTHFHLTGYVEDVFATARMPVIYVQVRVFLAVYARCICFLVPVYVQSYIKRHATYCASCQYIVRSDWMHGTMRCTFCDVFERTCDNIHRMERIKDPADSHSEAHTVHTVHMHAK